MRDDERMFEYLANDLIINTSCLEDVGLYHGKMGISIFFFHYARYTQNGVYEDFAGELLDEIYGEISANTPIAFVNGLCGIGWGMIYLYQQGFVEGDIADVLADIDQEIMEYDYRQLQDTSLERGLAGIAFYVRSRMKMNCLQNSFTGSYLSDMEHCCQERGINTEVYSLSDLMRRVEYNGDGGSAIPSWQKALIYVLK